MKTFRFKQILTGIGHFLIGILIIGIGFVGGMNWTKYQQLKKTNIIPKNIRGSYLASYQTPNTRYNQIIQLTSNYLYITNTDYQKHNQESYDADPFHQAWQRASLKKPVEKAIINKHYHVNLRLSNQKKFKLRINKHSIQAVGNKKERTRYLKIPNSLANGIITRNNNNQR